MTWVAELNKLRALGPGYSTLTAFGAVYALAGRRAEAQRILQEVKDISKQKYTSPFQMVKSYACRGEKDTTAITPTFAYLGNINTDEVKYGTRAGFRSGRIRQGGAPHRETL